MKIFISWSGEKSKHVAIFLKDWLQSVIQAVNPWMSTDDIEKGSIWFTDINNALADVKIGIVVLTQENKNKPWILFESGALAKGLSTTRVCTFLVDLKPSDILQNPLSNFNHTSPTSDGIFKLLETINKNLEHPLNDRILSNAFHTFYPQFVGMLSELSELNFIEPHVVEEDKQRNILDEVLQLVRNIEKRTTDNFLNPDVVGRALKNELQQYELKQMLELQNKSQTDVKQHFWNKFHELNLAQFKDQNYTPTSED